VTNEFNRGGKGVLKGSPPSRQRLDCGGFSTAFPTNHQKRRNPTRPHASHGHCQKTSIPWFPSVQSSLFVWIRVGRSCYDFVVIPSVKSGENDSVTSSFLVLLGFSRTFHLSQERKTHKAIVIIA